jgi:hypothetical protein
MLCVAESGFSLELMSQFLENKFVQAHHPMALFWVSYVEKPEINGARNTLSLLHPGEVHWAIPAQ